ncbi:MAG: glycosyltransferase family 4 protein [Actinobacteria bacterium]|nr:glycosyltransferase family 4 protein [Actinomycetota bacterium]
MPTNDTGAAGNGSGLPLRVAHLTAVHPRDDARIFTKECCALRRAGYEVHLVAPGGADTVRDGVHIHAVTASSTRVRRMTRTALAVYQAAREIDADIYHFHDPELIPIALMLRRGSKLVVYDSHEHLPQQILTKPWIASPLRRPLAFVADLGERAASRFMSAVVTAEPYVRRRFTGTAVTTVTVGNYPMLEEFPVRGTPFTERERAVCYAGALTELRGVHRMVRAIDRTDATLYLAGRFQSSTLEYEVSCDSGWRRVRYLGHVTRAALADMLARVRAGLVVLDPIPNYVEANPTKMFEYMSAGIPVIASDFPVWREIISRYECGVCVDPTSVDAIADAIQTMLDDPEAAERMGQNGRRAVECFYNWEEERRILLTLYAELAGGAAALGGVRTAIAG